MSQNKCLQLLKTKGPLTANTVAKELGITGEGARLHLVKLSKAGLVKATSLSKGVGRPVQVYELTELGNSAFADTHTQLTVQLLNTVKQQLGEHALDLIMASREGEMLKKYKEALGDYTDLESRIRGYAQIRSTEGFMAEVSKENNGQFVLIENHCPILAAAHSCDGFCQSDIKIISQVLNENVKVERIEHIASGGRRCSYRIKKS